jgi:glyoxylase-like metal-dependent hydrolase (beta-lactamase superfamily II)
MPYRIQLLKMGQVEVPGPEVYWMSDWERWETLFIWALLIQGEGKNILLNTGPPRDLTELNACWAEAVSPRSQMIRQEHERPENALKAVGLSVDEIDYVLITPLQAYTTGNIPLFKNARVCISRRGWIEDFHAPEYEMHIPRRLRIPDETLYYLDLTAPDKVLLLKDEDEVLPGLRAFWAGVHHRSSMAYCIETAQGVVVASDAYFKYRNIEADHPLGVGESLAECHVTYSRVRREAGIVLPLYDPEVLQRFPEGTIG